MKRSTISREPFGVWISQDYVISGVFTVDTVQYNSSVVYWLEQSQNMTSKFIVERLTCSRAETCHLLLKLVQNRPLN